MKRKSVLSLLKFDGRWSHCRVRLSCSIDCESGSGATNLVAANFLAARPVRSGTAGDYLTPFSGIISLHSSQYYYYNVKNIYCNCERKILLVKIIRTQLRNCKKNRFLMRQTNVFSSQKTRSFA